MSIVRVGLAESGNFGEGYDAIFGKKKEPAAKGKKAKAVRSAAKKTKADKPAAKSASKAAPKKGKKPVARKK